MGNSVKWMGEKEAGLREWKGLDLSPGCDVDLGRLSYFLKVCIVEDNSDS